MAIAETCKTCKGQGHYECLTSQHDDKTETVKCERCNGTGTQYVMTDNEERDYYADYW